MLTFLIKAVYHRASVVGMRISASKTKVMLALSPGEQRQAGLLDGEPLDDIDKFIANGQGAKEIRSRINLARFAFSDLQSCLWSRREMTLPTKGRVYQAVVRWLLRNGCET